MTNDGTPALTGEALARLEAADDGPRQRSFEFARKLLKDLETTGHCDIDEAILSWLIVQAEKLDVCAAQLARVMPVVEAAERFRDTREVLHSEPLGAPEGLICGSTQETRW